MKNIPLVIAYYDKEGEEQTKLTINFDLMWKSITSNLKYYFTKKIEITKPHYTKIYSVTEKGLEKLDEIPKNISLFISAKEDDL